MDYTERLANLCAGVSVDRLSSEVIQKAKLCILDFVANVYGSMELDAVRGVAAYIRSLGGAESATALGWGFKTGTLNAAFINGTTAEAIEAQDGLRFGGNHPGTAVIPASIVVAEDLGLGGKDVIEAVVAGYDAANRVAAAMHPRHTLSGFLPTGTCGTFGAAAAVARLKGLDIEGMLNTLGNAGYILPISMAEQLMGGYTIKIVQGGQAAAAGIMAAGLAASGITGEPYVLEGSDLKGGFTQITTDTKPNLEKITEGLGEHYTIMDVYFKPYTACRHTHGAIQATLELIKERPIDPSEIKGVKVYTYGMAVIAVGKGVEQKDTFVSAQFSIPYCVSACLIDKEFGPRQLKEERMADPAVITLSKKISAQMDDELNKVYPDLTSSRVEVTLKDGKKLVKQIDIPKGDPRDPMTEKDLCAKVKYFAGNRDEKTIAKTINMILDLENVGKIKELTKII